MLAFNTFKLLGFIFLAMAFNTQASSLKHPPKQKIVVVGAGLAGLTAAYRLYQKGHDIEVYEARARVGGRVHTVLVRNFDGSYSNAELGAQNITDGGDAKHILTLIKELDLEVINEHIPFQGQFYHDGNYYERTKIVEQINKQNPNLAELLKAEINTPRSMETVLNKLYLNDVQKAFLMFVMNAYEGLPVSLLSTHIHNIKTLQYVLSGGLSQAHANLTEKPLLHRMSIKAGNASLPEELAGRLGNRLHLNKILKAVNYNNSNDIELTFSGDQKVKCDILILAIPCSVYNDIQFDERLINKNKLKQIHSLHYGTISKILMPVKAHAEQKGHWLASAKMGVFFNDDHQLFNLYCIHHKEHTLLDQDFYQNTLLMLKGGFNQTLFKDTNPSAVEDMNFIKYDTPVAKSWEADPYSKGAYSAFDITIQDAIDKREFHHGIAVKALFAPIHDQLFFAGEHATILDEIGTMEAAVESGDRIAALINLIYVPLKLFN